jgi:hypothetical protein
VFTSRTISSRSAFAWRIASACGPMYGCCADAGECGDGGAALDAKVDGAAPHDASLQVG